MAALPAGVQYELSSEPNNEGNKDLVFVKLTDSALKAIEEFLKEQKKDGSAKPKVQFLPGNEGKISIPAIARGNDRGLSGEAIFHFSIRSNAETEGTRGSFVCVTSGGARRLESCRPLPHRIRVHANDDSYAVTRDRIASTVAAGQRKRIRVIKSVGAPSRSTAAAASVTVRPDEPPHKKRCVSHYRRLSPPSSGFATTFSSERQAEDLRPSPVKLKTAVLDDIKKIALRNVFGRRLKIIC